MLHGSGTWCSSTHTVLMYVYIVLICATVEKSYIIVTVYVLYLSVI